MKDHRRVPTKRLGLGDFAFYRAYLEGSAALNLTALADTYLNCGRDPRRVRVILRTLQDELAAGARRTNDLEAMRLLRLPRTLGATDEAGQAEAQSAEANTDLDAFALDFDPDGVYTQQELIAAYAAQRPSTTDTRKVQQAARLRERRLAALKRLESAIVDAPRAEHSVEGWFEPTVAARLTEVGLTTLGKLVDAINVFGHRWYIRVPRVGREGAERIVRWLQANAKSLDRTIADEALTPLRQQDTQLLLAARTAHVALGGTDVAPLEALRVPHALSGYDGVNRAEASRNRSGANNDLEAIHLWLSLRPKDSHTFRSYRTQAERLLLWSVFVCGKPLSSLDVRDIVAYKAFMAVPDPEWVSATKTPRWHKQWRPFSGPLSLASRATACAVLKSCFTWLVKMRYLDHNPWDGIASTEAEKAAIGIKVHHALTRSQWEALFARIDARATDLVGERSRFLVLLGYATGLRVAEMSSSTLGDLALHWVDEAYGEAWTLTVIGKRSKRRVVPIQGFVMTALTRYLLARGLPGDPRECDPRAPLITRSGAAATALPPLRIGRIVRRAMLQASGDLAGSDSVGSRRLALATAHWLRHTHTTHAIEAGAELDVMQENLGHASLATTQLYVTTKLDRRIRAMDKALKMPGQKHDALGRN